jgi:hypothetical protein
LFGIKPLKRVPESESSPGEKSKPMQFNPFYQLFSGRPAKQEAESVVSPAPKSASKQFNPLMLLLLLPALL